MQFIMTRQKGKKNVSNNGIPETVSDKMSSKKLLKFKKILLSYNNIDVRDDDYDICLPKLKTLSSKHSKTFPLNT